jgi:hypothetical protein
LKAKLGWKSPKASSEVEEIFESCHAARVARFFACWAIVFFDHLSDNYRSRDQNVKLYFDKKMGLGYIMGDLIH